MLLLILLWVAVFGHSSWTSTFITVLGAMFAVAAAIGAVLGTWFGKRRRSPG
jgi:VIT1/CCC1 family predicted Fe2+/Mn2+ transporter